MGRRCETSDLAVFDVIVDGLEHYPETSYSGQGDQDCCHGDTSYGRYITTRHTVTCYSIDQPREATVKTDFR